MEPPVTHGLTSTFWPPLTRLYRKAHASSNFRIEKYGLAGRRDCDRIRFAT